MALTSQTLTKPNWELSESNYYDLESDRRYMSNSLYKRFLTCEAQAMAYLAGEWQDKPNEALLIGSYVHAAMESEEALESFKLSTPQLFKKDGDLKSEYKNADRMVETLKADEFIMWLYQGPKEVIVTAEMFGVWWKAKLDVLNTRIVDLKTTRSIRDPVWTPEYGRSSFVEGYGYLRQLALYREIERRSTGRSEPLEALIIAVSKEDPPDKEVIGCDEERLAIELEEVENHMPRILDVIYDRESPVRCERCDFCRMSKRLSNVVHYGQLVG